MPATVTLNIDGMRLTVPNTATVLEAALSNGVCIPTLCQVPELLPTGVCRLCIVEVVKGERINITTSCTLAAQEGMVIRTNTDRIRKLRRNIAELLVAEAPNSRAIQDIAVRLGVEEVRYPFHNSDCVQCGRCIRVCNEIWHGEALGFIGRGAERTVMYPFGVRPDTCKQEGGCESVCPMRDTPCIGIMEPGEERLCGLCQAQTMTHDMSPGLCVSCTLGKSFQCANHLWQGLAVDGPRKRVPVETE